METDAAVEIRKERGFPPQLEKSLAKDARLFHSSHRPSNKNKKTTSSEINLLRLKNGLDFGVHRGLRPRLDKGALLSARAV
jgi:hypothetical protein